MRRAAGWTAMLLPWSGIACLAATEGLPQFTLSFRQASLLGISVAGAFAAGLIALVLGGGAALWARTSGVKHLAVAVSLLTLASVLPPVISASAALSLFSRVSPYMTQGWVPSTLVQGLTFAPLTALILLLTFQSLSGDEIDSARVMLCPASAYQKVILKLSWQGAVTALAAATLFSALDFTVPTLFGLTTSMVEVYSDLSSGSPTLTAAWPHLLLSFSLSCLLGAWLSKTAVPRSGSRPTVLPLPPTQLRMGASFSTTLLCLSFLFLLVLLALEGLTNAKGGTAVSDALPDLRVSLILASATGLMTVFLGLLGGRELSSSKSWVVWALVLTPACFPPALIGSAGVHLAALLGVEGLAAPALVQCLRFLPIATSLSAVWWARRDPEINEASLIFLPRARRLLKASIPLLSPVAIAGFVLVYAMSLGELGATLLVIPPGFSTLTLRLYNYLHYGSAPDSAVLTLLLVGLAALPLAGLPLVRKWSNA